MAEPTLDAVVVGAGLSGLQTARLLADAGKRVAVLEARDRVGGRTLSLDVGGLVVDLGAQWIGVGQRRVEALARSLGVGLFPTHAKGKHLIELDGAVKGYRGKIPAMPMWDLLSAQRMMWRIAALVKQLDTDSPLTARRAAEWDRVTVAGFCHGAGMTRRVLEAFTAAFRVIFGAEPEQLSLLHFLFYVRCAGGFERLVDTEEGAQRDRFVEGAQELSRRLASSLGGAVALRCPVRAVAQEGELVRVEAGGRTLRAKRLVVAAPPALAQRIEFAPRLPPGRALFLERFHGGAAVKVHLIYPRSFWREAGFSGEAVVGKGCVSLVFDNTSHDGKVASLLAFVGGRNARAWEARPESERRTEVVDALVRLFGREAAAPLRVVEQDWSTEEWSRGGPVYAPGPGVWTELGDGLRAPTGRVHWAGTETAREWMGFLEGALESAERVAAEVRAALA